MIVFFQISALKNYGTNLKKYNDKINILLVFSSSKVHAQRPPAAEYKLALPADHGLCLLQFRAVEISHNCLTKIPEFSLPRVLDPVK